MFRQNCPRNTAAEHQPYHENDTDPFVGPIHVLISTGGGPDEVDLDMCDRDVVSMVKADCTTLRLLHLQNVRADMVAVARTAFEDFLNELKLDDDRKGAAPREVAHTMLDAYGEVHEGLRDHIEEKGQGA